MERKFNDPIFIVGVPRSGTTWVWGLLTSHNDVLSLEKDDFDSNERSIVNNKRVTSETGAFIRYENDFIKKIILDKQFSVNFNKLLIEKTPTHIQKIDKILSCFPNCKIIYVHRNPYAVISSMLNSKFYNFASNIKKAVKKYKNNISGITEYLKKDIFHVIKYEDLHSNPCRTIERLLDFCNLDSSKIIINNIINENHKVSKVHVDGVFRVGKIDSYISELSNKELNYINKELKDYFDIESYL